MSNISRIRSFAKAIDTMTIGMEQEIAAKLAEKDRRIRALTIEGEALLAEVARLTAELAWARDYILVLEVQSGPKPMKAAKAPSTPFRLTPLEGKILA